MILNSYNINIEVYYKNELVEDDTDSDLSPLNISITNIIIDYKKNTIPQILIYAFYDDLTKALKVDYMKISMVNELVTESTNLNNIHTNLKFSFLILTKLVHNEEIVYKGIIGTPSSYFIRNTRYLGDNLSTAISTIAGTSGLTLNDPQELSNISGTFYQFNESDLKCLCKLLSGVSLYHYFIRHSDIKFYENKSESEINDETIIKFEVNGVLIDSDKDSSQTDILISKDSDFYGSRNYTITSGTPLDLENSYNNRYNISDQYYNNFIQVPSIYNNYTYYYNLVENTRYENFPRVYYSDVLGICSYNIGDLVMAYSASLSFICIITGCTYNFAKNSSKYELASTNFIKGKSYE